VNAFINEVEAISGVHATDAESDELVSRALGVINAIDASP